MYAVGTQVGRIGGLLSRPLLTVLEVHAGLELGTRNREEIWKMYSVRPNTDRRELKEPSQG